MCQLYIHLNRTTVVLISLSVALLSGFLLTRLTERVRLPNVSGYILAGVLIGPCVLNAVPADILAGMDFVSDIALSLIAFGVGRFFKKESFRQAGGRTVVITLFESLAAGVLITLCMRLVFHFDWSFSLILGAIATATAPASTMMTINQYHAKGPFVTILLQVVALDDVVCLLTFSVMAAVCRTGDAGRFALRDALLPLAYNLAAPLAGFLCGWLLSLALRRRRNKETRLLLTMALLLGIAGGCAMFSVSPLLASMAFGAAYVNFSKDKKLFRQVNSFSLPILSLFFIVSGMNLDLRSLASVGVVGAAYFLVRIAGKYSGAFAGCLVTRAKPAVRNYFGLALVPQAGVAIGLAFLGQRLLPQETGSLLLTIILSSSMLYELIGPACAKAALILSGSIGDKAQRKTRGTAPDAAESTDAPADLPALPEQAAAAPR